MARLSLPKRNALTLIEATVTLAVLGVLGIILAQCMVWSLRERARLMQHQLALELATNVLEAARAQSWEQLNATWASTQTMPDEVIGILPEGKLIVTLEPLEPRPHLLRVTVEVQWQQDPQEPPRIIRLTTVLGERQKQRADKKS